MLDAEIEDLYTRYGHYLFQRCRNLLGTEDEAYDALQEVFVRVVKTRPKLDPGRSPLAWLNRVTTNLCLNRLRARKYRSHLAIDEVRELADCSPRVFVSRLAENRDLVRRLLEAADERTQAVVVGYFFDERKVEYIADELGISVPTVRRVLKRFLTDSRTRLEAETPHSDTARRRIQR